MNRLPAWVSLVAGLFVTTAVPFTSGALRVVVTFLAPLSLVVVYLRGRRDVDEVAEACDCLAEAWQHAAIELDDLRRGDWR